MEVAGEVEVILKLVDVFFIKVENERFWKNCNKERFSERNGKNYDICLQASDPPSNGTFSMTFFIPPPLN